MIQQLIVIKASVICCVRCFTFADFVIFRTDNINAYAKSVIVLTCDQDALFNTFNRAQSFQTWLKRFEIKESHISYSNRTNEEAIYQFPNVNIKPVSSYHLLSSNISPRHFAHTARTNACSIQISYSKRTFLKSTQFRL